MGGGGELGGGGGGGSTDPGRGAEPSVGRDGGGEESYQEQEW
jgi:hypothetical protein